MASADETTINIEEICKKNEIVDERVGLISDLIRDVLFGLLPPEEFEERLKEVLGLKAEVSKALTQEVEELIFDPVRESLDELYKKGISRPQVVDEAKPKQEVGMAENKGDEHWIEAMALYSKAEGSESDEEILAHVDSAIELGLSTSEEAGIRVIRAGVFVRRERFSEAEAEIRKALELDENLGNPCSTS